MKIINWMFQYWQVGMLLSFLLSIGLMVDSRPKKWTGDSKNITGTWRASVLWFVINILAGLLFIVLDVEVIILWQTYRILMDLIPIVVMLLLVRFITLFVYSGIRKIMIK